jgi:hypothetical protein
LTKGSSLTLFRRNLDVHDTSERRLLVRREVDRTVSLYVVEEVLQLLTLSIVNRNTNLRRLFTRNSSRLKVNDIFSDDGSSRRLGGGFNANRPRSLYRRRLGSRLDGGSGSLLCSPLSTRSAYWLRSRRLGKKEVKLSLLGRLAKGYHSSGSSFQIQSTLARRNFHRRHDPKDTLCICILKRTLGVSQTQIKLGTLSTKVLYLGALGTAQSSTGTLRVSLNLGNTSTNTSKFR